MGSMLVGLYGVFLMLTALHGNGPQLLAYLSQESSFVPWIIALMVLAALNGLQATHDFVAPFLFLAIIATIVSRWNDVQPQVLAAYQYLYKPGA